MSRLSDWACTAISTDNLISALAAAGLAVDMNINVVGTSGAGKSTLARRLADALALPYVEMDSLFWLPDWQQTPDAELRAKVAAATARKGWVLDGNYDRTRDVKWRDVDLVVWVDSGFTRTLYQAVTRAVSRAWYQDELWPGTGNRESFRASFLSRDSIIWWTASTWSSNRARYEGCMRDPQYAHIRFVRVQSPSDADALVSELVAGLEPAE